MVFAGSARIIYAAGLDRWEDIPSGIFQGIVVACAGLLLVTH